MIHNRQKNITGVYTDEHEIICVYYGPDLVWSKYHGEEYVEINGVNSLPNGETTSYNAVLHGYGALSFDMNAENVESYEVSPDGKTIVVTSRIDDWTNFTVNATVELKDGRTLSASKDVDVYRVVIRDFSIDDSSISYVDSSIFIPFNFYPDPPRGSFEVSYASITPNNSISIGTVTSEGIYLNKVSAIDKDMSLTLTVEITDEIGGIHVSSCQINVKSTEYLTFKPVTSTSFAFYYVDYDGLEATIEYSINNGEWHTMVDGEYTSIVTPNDSIRFRGLDQHRTGIPQGGIGHFDSSNGEFDISGKLMTLVNMDSGSDVFVNEQQFTNLFARSKVRDASMLELPHHTSKQCYEMMFFNCTSLISAPNISVDTLENSCCYFMFRNCTSLVNAPSIDASTAKSHCCESMFLSCSSLVNPPALLSPVTIGEACYGSMFSGCTSLTTTPELPATTLALNCYEHMFEGCTSLVSASELPALTLVYGCYYYMFAGCTSLTTSPVISALNNQANNACTRMFYNCSRINKVTAMFMTAPSNDYTQYWLQNVSGTGTFYMNSDASWGGSVTRGPSTVPTGWSIIGIPEHTTSVVLDQHSIRMNSSEHVTLTATVTPSTSVDPVIWSTSDSTIATVDQYGVVTGVRDGFVLITATSGNYSDSCTVSVSVHEQYLTIKPRGNASIIYTTINDSSIEYSVNNGEWTYLGPNTSSPGFTSQDVIRIRGNNASVVIGTTGSLCDIEGNIMSLIYKSDFADKVDGRNINIHFSNVKDASKLFLPATTNINYQEMFYERTSLTHAPAILPSMTLNEDCYARMFCGCESLVYPPILPAKVMATRCYEGMFEGCTSLTTSPVLPATTLAYECYDNMFFYCTSLTTVTALFTTTPGSSYTPRWMDYVPSSGTFYKNPDATWDQSITRSRDTVPENWTIANYQN